MIVFGPIPSRRLGRSLGVNNIPPKVCSYSCIYCQVGRTDSMSVKRAGFFSPEQIYKEVAEKIEQMQKKDEEIDYITFVPDGEPTLDINLGNTIERLKGFGFKIAVVTNSSLLWMTSVKNDLINADLVSLKIDSVFRDIWKKINRPHGELEMKVMIEGIQDFARIYENTLITETMLVDGVNDSVESLYKTAELINSIGPEKAYLLVPTRPPAEAAVKAPDERATGRAYQIFGSIIGSVEILDYSEGTDFKFFSEAEEELLSIISVHPMRKDAVENFLSKSGSSWELIESLINKNILRTEEYSGNIFLKKSLVSK